MLRFATSLLLISGALAAPAPMPSGPPTLKDNDPLSLNSPGPEPKKKQSHSHSSEWGTIGFDKMKSNAESPDFPLYNSPKQVSGITSPKYLSENPGVTSPKVFHGAQSGNQFKQYPDVISPKPYGDDRDKKQGTSYFTADEIRHYEEERASSRSSGTGNTSEIPTEGEAGTSRHREDAGKLGRRFDDETTVASQGLKFNRPANRPALVDGEENIDDDVEQEGASRMPGEIANQGKQFSRLPAQPKQERETRRSILKPTTLGRDERLNTPKNRTPSRVRFPEDVLQRHQQSEYVLTLKSPQTKSPNSNRNKPKENFRQTLVVPKPFSEAYYQSKHPFHLSNLPSASQFLTPGRSPSPNGPDGPPSGYYPPNKIKTSHPNHRSSNIASPKGTSSRLNSPNSSNDLSLHSLNRPKTPKTIVDFIPKYGPKGNTIGYERVESERYDMEGEARRTRETKWSKTGDNKYVPK